VQFEKDVPYTRAGQLASVLATLVLYRVHGHIVPAVIAANRIAFWAFAPLIS